jgi:hypothetical protein
MNLRFSILKMINNLSSSNFKKEEEETIFKLIYNMRFIIKNTWNTCNVKYNTKKNKDLKNYRIFGWVQKEGNSKF